METIRRAVLLLSLALGVPLSQASEVAPDALLSSVTSEVIAVLKQGKEQAETPAKLADLVETKVLPLFNFFRMTKLAMARNWRLATREQQNVLTAEFRTLLVHTYSAALLNYRDRTVGYKRLRTAPGDTEVTVRSDVKRGAEQIRIDYDMEKTPAGWKVYDIKLDGVSLVTSYREGFAARVRDIGVDGLIKSLSEKNRQGDSTSAPASPSEDKARLLDRVMRSALQAGG
ncbi:MAG: ABC transporter substrate-binding protein [Betaproteobacteria bacterium]|nr:ABC transporter substrate-binding protein [Betaproteobacteria bacterium]